MVVKTPWNYTLKLQSVSALVTKWYPRKPFFTFSTTNEKENLSTNKCRAIISHYFRQWKAILKYTCHNSVLNPLKVYIAQALILIIVCSSTLWPDACTATALAKKKLLATKKALIIDIMSCFYLSVSPKIWFCFLTLEVPTLYIFISLPHFTFIVKTHFLFQHRVSPFTTGNRSTGSRHMHKPGI